MKQFLTLVYLLLISTAFGQVPYEQIAFDFYIDSIIKNQTLNVEKEINENQAYLDIDCLKEFNLRIDDTVAAGLSGSPIKELNISKIKGKAKKSAKPRVFATRSYSYDEGRCITAIVEEYKTEYKVYIFEITTEGIIRKWCFGSRKN